MRPPFAADGVRSGAGALRPAVAAAGHYLSASISAWILRVDGVQERVDVRVLVGQHGLDDRVERGVEVLRVLVRLGHDLLVEDLVGERRHVGRAGR